MSGVYIGVGQCGSQVLASFLSHTLEQHADNPAVVDLQGKCRAVFVDSEPKVVQRLSSSPLLRGRIREKNLIHGSQGRGSNWSFGYHGCRSEEHLVSEAVESSRRELERGDSVGGFVLCHSLAGGTGSGLGSRLSEVLRDHFGLRFLLHCAVSPHQRGESPLQAYNTALSLAHLLDSADGVLLFNNDHLLLQAHAGEKAEAPAANQETINRQLAHQLASLLLPCRSLYIHSRYTRANQEPWELSRCLWSLPEAKLAQCVSSARRSRSTAPVDWLELTKALSAQGRAAVSTWLAPDDFLRDTLAAVCVARGDNGGTFASRLSAVREKLQKALRPVAWNREHAIEFWTDPAGAPPNLTLAFNSASFGSRTLGCLAHRCLLKAQSGAYLHWFARHGTSRSDILAACRRLESAAASYEWLAQTDAS